MSRYEVQGTTVSVVLLFLTHPTPERRGEKKKKKHGEKLLSPWDHYYLHPSFYLCVTAPTNVQYIRSFRYNASLNLSQPFLKY